MHHLPKNVCISMLAFKGKGIEYKSSDIMIRLYKSLVRPRLEYYVQFWLPIYRKDTIKLEKVHENIPQDVIGICMHEFSRDVG